MAINTYTTLKDAIYKWLVKNSNDAFYTSSMVDDIIFLAEAELSRRLRVRQMRTTDDLIMTPSNNAVALPADYREAYSVYYSGGNSPQEIQYASPALFARNSLYQQSGLPGYFYIDGESIILGPTPDSGYEFTLDYYADIPNLSGSVADNLVLLAYPDLYLVACLKQAYIASQDDTQEAKYEARLEKMIAEIQKEDNKNVAAKGLRGVARQII